MLVHIFSIFLYYFSCEFVDKGGRFVIFYSVEPVYLVGLIISFLVVVVINGFIDI